MSNVTMTDKFLNSVVVTLIARATLLAMPIVGTFIVYITMQIYNDILKTNEDQSQEISKIQSELQDHQFRLDADRLDLTELRQATQRQFANIDQHLDLISDKVVKISESMIRVQTIVETRLPAKEGNAMFPKQ